MAKTDRGILVSNDQEFGMIADPNKLETMITHAYDTIDTNDDELIAHKSSGDHDGRYYTKAQLDAGQLDNRYYTETEIDTKVNNLQSQITTNANDINAHKTSGDHDTRYYTKTQLDGGQLDNRYYTETELNGSGGASKIGISPISGLTASNVQQALESVNNKINQTALGQIPDGSITPQKLAFDPATQAELEAHSAETATSTELGHVKVDDLTIQATNGVISTKNRAKYDFVPFTLLNGINASKNINLDDYVREDESILGAIYGNDTGTVYGNLVFVYMRVGGKKYFREIYWSGSQASYSYSNGVITITNGPSYEGWLITRLSIVHLSK
ncbi:hypothetical protein ETC05_16515 [Geobacillus sp. BMUD]|uniref:hypothetical protein n=1 Tax=Geobacillus sp. BMUD TaxID=2508876 RepID=UPI0014916AD8|nr:hypothetical protein [Geobacillus sp. BMUD]NNU85342.1 hypothetical protein [Geobacillus sp. BMUD]